MPSLYKDAPAVPIMGIGVHRVILRLLERQNQGAAPAWWSSVSGPLEALLDVGITVHGRPSANIVWSKLQAVAEASRNITAIEIQITNQLPHGSRTLAHTQCAAAHLTYFLGVVDEWLRVCEQFAQESRRYPDDFGNMESAYTGLNVAAGQHADVVNCGHLIHLFSSLQSAGAGRSCGVATPSSDDSAEEDVSTA